MAYNQKDYITIGEVLSPHGQKGEIRIKVLTEFPERFKHGQTVYVEGNPLTIEASSQHRETAIIKLSSVDTLQAARLLARKNLQIPECERIELPPGRFYQHDILGLEVWTTSGECLGTVREILGTGRNDIYVVKADDKELLIPAVKEVVKEINLSRKRITVEMLEGLVE